MLLMMAGCKGAQDGKSSHISGLSSFFRINARAGANTAIRLTRLEAEKKQLEMDDSTFSVLLDWIPEVCRQNNVKVNIVNFLGGEPLLRTDRIKKVMDAVYANTKGMQGLVNTNGDLVDTVNWDDLESIQWMTINITDLALQEFARRMKIIQQRSNVINQTIAATLDQVNLARVTEIVQFGIENGYRLRLYKDLNEPLDSEDYREL
jgi:uncharacterized protein